MQGLKHLDDNQIKQFNDFKNFISFIPTWAYTKFLNAEEDTVAQFTGNQYGKTSGTARSYVMRCLSLHPVPKKNIVYWECENVSTYDEKPADGCHTITRVKNSYTNQIIIKKRRSQFNLLSLPPDLKCPQCHGKILLHHRETNSFRFCAETLPGQSKNLNRDGESAETKNTQYPAFKQWLPPFLIKDDISTRNTSMIIHNIIDPDGSDILIDYTGYTQTAQAQAGVRRVSIWYDEEPPLDIRHENIPRLLRENGDEIITVTPANHITWMYDEIYENASVYYRTPAVVEFLKSRDGVNVPQIEYTDSDKNIAVIQAATDDNPTLTKEAIKRMTDNYDDPDILAIRRYGIFKQVSGKIFKDYTPSVHIQSSEKLFGGVGIPLGWRHGRGIDYHPQTPWGVACVSISPQNEAFVWLDMNPSPERYTVEEIAEDLALRCGDYKFRVNLVDPLIKGTVSRIPQKTCLDDLNKAFHTMKHDNIGTGGYWTVWNTKGDHGLNEIKKRLKNSLMCKKPFNNIIDGVRVPTIWFLSNCKYVTKCMKQWRWEEFKNTGQSLGKSQKNKPEQAWSHHIRAIEALFKDYGFCPPSENLVERKPRRQQTTGYFKGRRNR